MAEKRKKKSLFSLVIHFMVWPAIVLLVCSILSIYIPPQKAWIFAIFGLTYPLIISFNILLIIILFLMKSKRKWILLACFLIVIPYHIDYFSIGYSTEPDKTNKTLSVLSYNVRLFDYYTQVNNNKSITRDSIFNYIQNIQSDVLCFQEYYRSKKHNFINQQTISSLGKYNYFKEFFRLKNKNTGLAIYSKHKIINSDRINFENNPSQYGMFVDILVEKDTFRVYNIHLQSIYINEKEIDVLQNPNSRNIYDETISDSRNIIKKLKQGFLKRESQAKQIVEHALKSPYPSIICGDFNDTPISYVYHLFDQAFNDAFSGNTFGFGRTYAGDLPAGRIDYIFSSKELKATQFNIQDSRFSDHYAINALFEYQ